MFTGEIRIGQTVFYKPEGDELQSGTKGKVTGLRIESDGLRKVEVMEYLRGGILLDGERTWWVEEAFRHAFTPEEAVVIAEAAENRRDTASFQRQMFEDVFGEKWELTLRHNGAAHLAFLNPDGSRDFRVLNPTQSQALLDFLRSNLEGEAPEEAPDCEWMGLQCEGPGCGKKADGAFVQETMQLVNPKKSLIRFFCRDCANQAAGSLRGFSLLWRPFDSGRPEAPAAEEPKPAAGSEPKPSIYPRLKCEFGKCPNAAVGLFADEFKKSDFSYVCEAHFQQAKGPDDEGYAYIWKPFAEAPRVESEAGEYSCFELLAIVYRRLAIKEIVNIVTVDGPDDPKRRESRAIYSGQFSRGEMEYIEKALQAAGFPSE